MVFRQHLSSKKRTSAGSFVSVLIPARNEEENIGILLNDIINLDYENLEILVFNDQSTDKTESIVNEFIAKDKRIRIINSNELPAGWLGKNFACHSLAQAASGDYYLFLDADVRIKNSVLIDSLACMSHFKLGLLSIFPTQIMGSFGERISVPIMHFILLSLLPLILVRKLKPASLAAANGQFMLFDSEMYTRYLPHLKCRTSAVEDVEIARFLKKEQVKIACVTGNTDIECRMYRNLGEAINGFSKNVSTFFGNSFLLAILFWGITSFGFVAVLISLSGIGIMVYFTIILLTRIFVSIAGRQNLLWNLFLFPLQQISLGLFIYKAAINTIRKQYQWKGRNISN